MGWFESLRPAVFALDPERAHRLTIMSLKFLPRRKVKPFDPVLSSTVGGVTFPSPVGLAAGFDKDGEVPGAMLALGFGFVEIGTLTPLPQAGNPKPRLFRLVDDEAVINRLGFNNGGHLSALRRLKAAQGLGIIGVNIGANKDSADRIDDYVRGVRAMTPFASYLTVNISSPNTPGLRALQDKGALRALLDGVDAARTPRSGPVFLKLAPDLDTADIDDIVGIAAGRIDALIVANTTISRPPLISPHGAESGGLSGKPLRSLARERLRDFRQASGGLIPLIAVGGIADADDAYARIRMGASLIQIYSALVYHGPGLARTLSDGIASRLRRDGFASLGDAVGCDVR